MTFWQLCLRSLRYHWRAHLGVLLGVTVSTAVLVGALAVGDSVRYSLRQMALARLGDVHLALQGRSRFFRAELGRQLGEALNVPAAAVILLPGSAALPENEEERAGRVQVVGIDEQFWQLRKGESPVRLAGDEAAINTRLAQRLRLREGQEILLRVDKPSLLSRDAPLSTIQDASVPIRLRVAAIVPDRAAGRFSLNANQTPPLNAFVPMELLQSKLGLRGRANTLLVGAGAQAPGPDQATQALWKLWRFEDAGLELRTLPPPRGSTLELRTDRVFLEPAVGEAALGADPRAQGVLTYFVNELRLRDRATPYSTVAAMQGGPVPNDLRPNEMLINQWLAEDLGASPGDSITLRFWVAGPMRHLIEREASFRVRAILPMSGPALDPELMPNIPGLADKKDCRDWEPGVPIDLQKIRDKDQAYWDRYRGTPKAFISLEAGRALWQSRFGDLTAVRFQSNAASREDIEAHIRQAINPGALGLFFVPVRQQALAAGEQSLDFGQLFLGFSFFLIVAGLLLTALLFAFGAEQRGEESGILLALGFKPRTVQRLLLGEGAALAAIASTLGVLAAGAYTRALVWGLSGVWSGAVAGAALTYHAETATLVGGGLAAFLCALGAIWLVTRGQARAPVRVLLAGGIGETQSVPRLTIGRSLTLALALLGTAVVLSGAAFLNREGPSPGLFFGAGALLLAGAMALCRAFLAALTRADGQRQLTLGLLGIRNSARRPARSLAVIGLLACGAFLVVAVGAGRKDPAANPDRPESGTGGFAFYGETTLPVLQDLNSPEGRETYSLDEERLAEAQIVPLRLREGDEASCLNLNRAQMPRLLAVDPEMLARRESFTFTAAMPPHNRKEGWKLLNAAMPDGAVPAVADSNTLTWALGRKVGDTVPYVDEQGRPFNLRIVGVIASSILQGGLIVAERQFLERFPSISGYNVILVNAPASAAEAVREELQRGLADLGVDLESAPRRLMDFAEVENTYLSIFAVLGGLGLLLGSVGLGVLVLRNVLERRSELALLRAVGFTRPRLRWLVLSEHIMLLALGLGAGSAAALVAVIPALSTPAAEVPYASLSITLAAVVAMGVLWTLGATVLALRGPLMQALRNE